MSSTLARIRGQRLNKVKQLRKLGINPYPARAERTHKNKELVDNFKKFEGKEVIVVGRIMSWREHGALRFAHLQDFSGQIQLIIKEDSLCQFDKREQRLGWKELSLLDIGDYVQAKGNLMKSKTGEISVGVKELKLLTKAIRPLPEKWEGIKDIETKLRRRYLDMTMDPKIKEVFARKALFWQYMRDFMNKEGFLEIRTPVLEHTTGGADANPFITHHDALDTDFYLRISLELPLKRAIGAGFEKVFEIGPVFRNEGIDDEHLQDYDMMEFYWAYADFRQGMDLVERLYKDVIMKTFKTLKFKIRGFNVDFSKKWEEIDYVETILDKYKIDVIKANEDEIRSKLKELKVKYEKNAQKARLVDVLWKQIRQEIAGPVFLVNQPKLVSPLAKSSQDTPGITERYQIIIAGSEMGNGYSELNDPIDQYDRFLEQQGMREAGDTEAQMLDVDFVEMLEYGMPPTSGFGVSERLFSFLVDKPIRQTVMFPQMRREFESATKEIYGLKNESKN
jgi:lysyl-tRNA synthetase class 2